MSAYTALLSHPMKVPNINLVWRNEHLTCLRRHIQTRTISTRRLPNDTTQDPILDQDLSSKHRQAGEDLPGRSEEWVQTANPKMSSALTQHRQLVSCPSDSNHSIIDTGLAWCSKPRRPVGKRCCSAMERRSRGCHSNCQGVDQDTRHDMRQTVQRDLQEK